ncbi:MAG: ABC transporter substrate-binding protein [Dehalococcoidia bacterium]|nr:ABC transporter substrate-binding protein [Dehalococcoidia bacterium]
MRKALSVLLILVITIGIFIVSCAPAQPAATTSPATTAPKGPTGEPIKLGATISLADVTGKQASNAMKLAAKEINEAGGVMGRPLEVVVVDDEAKGEKGAAALDKLATVDNVYAFIGGMSTGVHLGQIPALKKYKKPTVTIGAAVSGLIETAMVDQDWYFHLHPWDYQQAQSYIDGWKAIGAKYPDIKLGTWFIAYEEGAFGTGSFKGIQASWPEQGWNVTGDKFKSGLLGGGDYRAVLRQAKDNNPDVFLWVGYEADALPIAEQAKEVNFAPPIFLGAPPGWPSDFGKSPLAEGVMLYGMWAPSINEISTVSKHFYDSYVKEYGTPPTTYFAPLGYTNVYVVANAINKAGSLDDMAVIKALKETSYPSPVGETLTIKPSNTIQNQGFTAQKILQWQKGTQQVIWPFEFSKVAPAYPFPAWDKR